MAEDLSVDAAVSLLGASEQEPDEQTQQPEIEASSTEAEGASEAETPGDGENVETVAEAEAEPVPAPTWWTPEAKDKFAQLPPELQAVVLEQEGTRERVTSEAKEKASEARKAHDARAKELAEVVQKANEVLPKAVQAFQSRYEGVDWAAYARGVRDGQYDANQYHADKAQYDADQQVLLDAQAQAQRAHQEQRKLAGEAFETELATIVPALCDPSKGAANRQELGAYMVKNGIPKEVVDDLAAAPVGLFWKAMQFDKAQEALKSRPKPIPLKPAAAPTAAVQRTSQQRSAEQIRARLDKSGDVDDAVALLRARRA